MQTGKNTYDSQREIGSTATAQTIIVIDSKVLHGTALNSAFYYHVFLGKPTLKHIQTLKTWLVWQIPLLQETL